MATHRHDESPPSAEKQLDVARTANRRYAWMFIIILCALAATSSCGTSNKCGSENSSSTNCYIGDVSVPPPGNQPGSIAAYQNQVLATCAQVNSVLSEQHGDALNWNAHIGPNDDPFASLSVHRNIFLGYIRSNIDSARQYFTLLNAKEVPRELRQQQADAKKAQDAWLALMEQQYTIYEQQLRDGDPIGRVNKLSVDSKLAETRLNASMTALAGQNCQVV